MTITDFIIGGVMGLAAIIATASFSRIMGYLYNHGLADINSRTPDIRRFYKEYRNHTRSHQGRVGNALLVHGIAAGLFVATGVLYTIWRFIWPLWR